LVGGQGVPVNKEIIYLFGASTWGWVFRRPEHLAGILAENGWRVLFVETPLDFDLKNINFKNIFSKANRTIFSDKFQKGRLVEISRNLWIYKTPFILPKRIPLFLKKINLWLIRFMVRRILKQLNFTRPVLWVSYYRGADFIGSFNESLVCWDSMDEETGFTESFREKCKIRRQVRSLTRRADLVFTASKKLHEDKIKLNPNTHLIPNAVDSRYLTAPQLSACPPELSGMSRPILGFTGYLDDWVDIRLIRQIADFNRNWQVALIGPVRTDIAILLGRENVHLIQRKPYRLIAGYIRHFDVCLLPFKINPLTHAANPLKIYEYLALGKPVVAAATAEMEVFKDLVYLAKCPEEFIEQIACLLNDPGIDHQPRIARSQEFLRQHTWEKRGEEITRIIQGKL
jgi:glycosyltransferase involved in cell wall biosynthesis